MADNAFLNAYVQRAADALCALAGRPLTAGEGERLAAVAEERLRDTAAVLSNPYQGLRIETTLAKAAAWMLTRKPARPIVTGHGTLFKPHSEHRSVIGEMVAYLLGSRKVVKTRMFDLLREGRSPDDPEIKALDQRQKVFKLLANS
jgi:hypothetical protein